MPTFDFFVWALDNYARGELLLTLREQLPPWLLNPAFVFLCMCGGLGLLYLSHQRQLHRILLKPSQLVDVDQYREKERPGWLLPLLSVALRALVIAPVLALAYSLAYKGTAPSQAHLSTPPICKTTNCWPKPTAHSHQQPIVVSALGGNAIGSITGNGNVVAPSVTNNFGIHRQIQENIKPQLIADLSAHRGIVTINCVGCDGETMQFANDWYGVLWKAGWTVRSRPNSVITPEALVGLSITIRGEPVAEGEKFEVPNDSPAAALARAVMVVAPQHFVGFRKPDLVENEAIFEVGVMPRD